MTSKRDPQTVKKLKNTHKVGTQIQLKKRIPKTLKKSQENFENCVNMVACFRILLDRFSILFFAMFWGLGGDKK